MSAISTTLSIDELEEFDPNIYWIILDKLEEMGLDHNEVGEVEIIEPLGGLEVAVRNEEGDDVFTLELDPEDYSIRS